MMFGMLRYERADCGGPTQYDSSAMRTCSELRSASEKIATVFTPSSLHARTMRSAISPRLAISTLLNTSCPSDARRLEDFVRRWFGGRGFLRQYFDRSGVDDEQRLAEVD